MAAKSSVNESVLPVLSTIIIMLCVLFALAWLHQRRDTNDLRAQLQMVQTQQASDQFASYTQVAAEPTESKVYIPELHLALPLNQTTLSLMYSMRTTKTGTTSSDEADITTHAEAAYPMQQQRVRSCTSVARIKFETKADPYNPEEKPQPAVTLADGRVLQIYSSRLSSCNQEWQANGVPPGAIAAAFQQATSY